MLRGREPRTVPQVTPFDKRKGAAAETPREFAI